MDILVPRAEAFLILEECSQIDLVSEVSGVKAKLFHKLNSGGGGKVRKEEEETDVKWQANA